MNNRITDTLKKETRTICFWGYNKKILDECAENGIEISKIFSSNKKEVENNPNIFSSTEIYDYNKDVNGELLVFFPYEEKEVISNINQLRDMGIQGNQILCLEPKNRVIKYSVCKGPMEYNDLYGNHVLIKGGTVDKGIVSISIGGWNNEIVINEGTRIHNNLRIIISSSSNQIIIGEGVEFKKDNNIIQLLKGDGGNNIQIGQYSKFTGFYAVMGSNTSLKIGKKSTFGENTKFYLNTDAKLQIGDDCMFSTDIICQPCDGHSIMDLTTGRLANSPQLDNHDLIIENHVWVGRRAFILGKTRICQGSVIGAQSTVKGHYPNNVVIAGNPGRIVKKNIAWSRNYFATDKSQYNGYTNYTEES